MSLATWSFGKSVLFTVAALSAIFVVDQLVGCMSAAGQVRSSASGASVGSDAAAPATADELIRQMAGSAGIIFTGEVLAVRKPEGIAGSPEDAAGGVVEIDFHVDQALLGVTRNSVYTLREWSGLWTGGVDRYRPGQHLLMLLRQPNSEGLTSPVHGPEGVIPLQGIGRAPGQDDSAAEQSQWMVDVRWLRAQSVNRQLRVPAPLRGHLPVRGGRRDRSETLTSSARQEETTSLLTRAILGPWVEQPDLEPPVESLLHILEICADPSESHDAH